MSVPGTTASSESLLRPARRILRQIDDGPGQPLTAAIVGPGSTGKSALLDVLAQRYERAGIAVRRGWAPDASSEQAVLVDDAHLLEPTALTQLRAFAQTGEARVVVAYRPWPRPDELSALGGVLTKRHAPALLTHLDRTAIADRVAARVRCRPPDSLIDLVWEQSGGLPPYVDIVTQAMVSTGRFVPDDPRGFRKPDRVNVSAALAERLRYRMESLDPDVYRLLQAMAVGAALDSDVLGELLRMDVADLSDVAEGARATGLVTDSGELIQFVRNLILRLLPTLRQRDLRRRLAEIQLDAGGSALETGMALLGTGITGPKAAAALETAADEALHADPTHAHELLEAAAQAGASATALSGRRAYAAVLQGELDEGLRLAEQTIPNEHAPDRHRAMLAAAAALSHKGLGRRAGELYRRIPGCSALAVPWLFSAGDLARAREAADDTGTDTGLTTTLVDAGRLVARALLDSLDHPDAALSSLSRACGLLEPIGASVVLADSPAALAAVVALHSGEFTTGDSILRRAVTVKLGGRAVHQQHQLLHGWIAMCGGKFDVTHRMLAAVEQSGPALHPRDELLAASLAAGLARREDDRAALVAAWQRGRIALQTHPPDVFSVHQMGELAIAAARLGERDWILAHVKELEQVLGKIADPTLWTAPLHWYLLQAALQADDREAAGECVDALSSAEHAGPYVAAMARAARQWLAVDRGDVERDAIRDAADHLRIAGLRWDGANLAAHAASAARDRRVAAALLATARNLHDGAVRADDAAETVPELGDERERTTAREVASVLSDREHEVARLVVAGLTYKQIGERLFISTRTVEHHVARMRRRLGVTRRDEMFTRLAEIIDKVDR